MTIQQHASFDSSPAELSVASKLVKAWESKNAKNAAKAGGISMMALTLAACGGSSTTTTATTTTTTTTTADAAQALSLTSRGDNITGGSGDDTIDASLINEGGVANVQTLTATDIIDGGAGTDTLSVTYTTAITPFSIVNVENISLTDSDAATEIIDLVNVTGLETLSLTSMTTAGDVNNVANIVTLNITNNAVANNIDYAAAAVAGTADAQVVNLSSHTAGTLTLDAGIESVTINSNGGVANVMTLTATGVATATITGAAGFTGTFGTAATTINSSAATGAVRINQTGAQISNITTGAGDDIIDLSGNFVDGTTAASVDTVAAGAGADRLILTAAEAAAVTAAAQFSTITGIETVVVDTDGQANNISMVALGVSNLEFDGLLGAHTVTAVSGGEVQLDLADTGTDARTYIIGGVGTTDSLTIDINGVDAGNGAQTYTGIETLNIATSGTSLLDGAHVMTATAASEVMNISGTGTLTLGNVTADAITSTMTAGTLNLGTMQQSTNITSAADAMTVIGSTAADIFNGGAGADFFQNTAVGAAVTAGDVVTGGAGFDTFTLVGTAASAANYLGAVNITDFTVGTTTTNTDFLRFSADNTSYDDDGGTDSGLAEASGVDSIATGDAIVIQEIAQNAAASAVSGTTTNLFKLTTGVAFDTNLQTTFNTAIGTGTVTGLTADSQILYTMYDTTNSVMVVGSVDVNGTGTATVVETADVVNLIATVDMTAADYNILDADNFAVFIA